MAEIEVKPEHAADPHARTVGILVGVVGSTFIGNVVYSNIGIANNVPFAAALAVVPVAIMAAYLLIAKRLGAFEAL